MREEGQVGQHLEPHAQRDVEPFAHLVVGVRWNEEVLLVETRDGHPRRQVIRPDAPIVRIMLAWCYFVMMSASAAVMLRRGVLLLMEVVRWWRIAGLMATGRRERVLPPGEGGYERRRRLDGRRLRLR